MAFVSSNRFIPTNAYEVPDYTGAEIQDAQSRANVKNQENAIRSQNLLGAAYLYNKGMEAADKSPISDFISEKFDQYFPGQDSSGVEVVDKSMTTAEIDAANQAGNIPGTEVVDPTTTATIDPTLAGKPMTGTEVTMGGVDPNTLTNTASTATDLANAVNANANLATTAGTAGTAGAAGGAAGGASALVSMLGPVAAIAILSKLFG